MIRLNRILAAALLRFREGLRGPVVPFLCFFVILAVVAALAVPGEGGAERQRAVDGLVLDALLLVGILAAAALGAASLAADRESRRGIVLAAGPLRPSELILGGLLGHVGALAVLFAGLAAAALAVTGLFGGGARAGTRVPLRATALEDGAGRAAEGRMLLLRPESPEAAYFLPLQPKDLPAGRVRGWVHLTEYVADLGGPIPVEYGIGVKIGDGPEQILVNRTGNPLEFEVPREAIVPDGPTIVRLRHLDPAYHLGLLPQGLVVQGQARPFALNVGKAALAWLLAGLLVTAAAAALASFVGAPIAVAGALLLALLGRSVGLMEEAAAYAAESADEVLMRGGRLLEGLAGVVPDFQAYDWTRSVTARWDIAFADVLGRAGPALLGVAVCGLLGLLVLEVGRRR